MEAVFSSSEDRIRASQVAAGSPIAPHQPPACDAEGLSKEVKLTRQSRTADFFGAGRAWFRIAAESLFATLFPAHCRLCSRPLVDISRLPVCSDCLTLIRPIRGRVCSICGERVFAAYATSDARGARVCPVCRRAKRPFARAVAYGSYEGELRELVHLLKYGCVRPAANPLGQSLALAIGLLLPGLAEKSVIVVPVPLYKGKQRQRGFNQAELIARAALKALPETRFELASGVLRRVRETESQIGLTGHERRANLRGAFAVPRTGEVTGREVLLVDDVYTTGATVTECAGVLRRAGASQVWVATVARTLKLNTLQLQNERDAEDVEFGAATLRAAS